MSPFADRRALQSLLFWLPAQAVDLYFMAEVDPDLANGIGQIRESIFRIPGTIDDQDVRSFTSYGFVEP